MFCYSSIVTWLITFYCFTEKVQLLNTKPFQWVKKGTTVALRYHSCHWDIFFLISFRPHNLLFRGRQFIICVAFFSKFCQNSIFYSILNKNLGFTKELEDVRKPAFRFFPARYIRTFVVISEVNCVFLRRKRRFKNCTTSEFWRYIRSKLRSTKEEVNFRFSLSIEGGKYPIHNGLLLSVTLWHICLRNSNHYKNLASTFARFSLDVYQGILGDISNVDKIQWFLC